jgi:hypothetical protein
VPKTKSKSKAVDQLTLTYVELDTVAMWDRNKKKHDIDLIIKSLIRHGFKDPVKYEPALNKGAGGIVEGNGRIEALQTMKNQSPKKPPRGIYAEGKEWMVPVLFGVDAKSQSAAESYGYDHNNLTLGGSEIGLDGVMSMWEDDAVGDLFGLQAEGETPVSIGADGMDALLEVDKETLTEHEEQLAGKEMMRILISVPASIVIDVKKHVEAIEKIPGVEVDYSGNN